MELWKELSIEARLNMLHADMAFLIGRIEAQQDLIEALIRTHQNPASVRAALAAIPVRNLPNGKAVDGYRSTRDHFHPHMNTQSKS